MEIKFLYAKVYCSLRGPALKQPIQNGEKMGADVVGMSTIPETLFQITGVKFLVFYNNQSAFQTVLSPLQLMKFVTAMKLNQLTLLMRKLIERI
jgi:purine nucleoside phosphorylase